MLLIYIKKPHNLLVSPNNTLKSKNLHHNDTNNIQTIEIVMIHSGLHNEKYVY